MTTTYSLVFDGGSLGNPGRGYGSFRLRRAGQEWSEPVRLEFGPRVTNNEAEYRSLIDGLKAVRGLCGDPALAVLEVRSDSRLVLEQLAGRWRVRAVNLAPLHAAASALLHGFHSVKLIWQPRSQSVELLGH